MKITKTRLRKIILEELKKVSEADLSGKLSRQDMHKSALALGRGKADVDGKSISGGVTDEERGTITDLAQRMLKAAAKTNLEAGAIDKLTQRLLLALEQILGSEGQEQQAGPPATAPPAAV